MNKKAYLEQRQTLIAQAQEAIEEGKLDQAEDLKEKINQLDTTFTAQQQAKANLVALEQNPVSFGNQLEQLGGLAGAEGSFIQAEQLGAVGEIQDLTASVEYRQAFMNYVLDGTPMPSNLQNINSVTMTTDVTPAIPVPVVNRILEQMESYGKIFARVHKTSFPAGVKIPVSNIKFKAEWVGEGKGSDIQKGKLDEIIFTHHKLRCAAAQTLETRIMTIEAFEAHFVKNVVKAMVIAAEQAIVSGDGQSKPKGASKETPQEGQEISATGKVTDVELAEAALPVEYENNTIWLMDKKTFYHYAYLKDANGQYLGRVNYGGVAESREYILMGREVLLSEYLPTYGTAKTGEIFAMLLNLEDYDFNTNYDMRITKYEDHENENEITKAVMICDGKLVDKGSLVTLKKP